MQQEESQRESFHYQHRLQRGVTLSGSSFGYTIKQKVKLKANVITKYNIPSRPYLKEPTYYQNTQAIC